MLRHRQRASGKGWVYLGKGLELRASREEFEVWSLRIRLKGLDFGAGCSGYGAVKDSSVDWARGTPEIHWVQGEMRGQEPIALDP